MKILTLNTGLFAIAGVVGPVAYPHIRIGQLAYKLNESEADVICLQEVFSFDHVNELATTLVDTHPHIFYSQPHGNKFSSGLLIFSKLPFESTHELELPTPWFERLYVKRSSLGVVINENGIRHLITNTHLTASNWLLQQDSRGAARSRMLQINYHVAEFRKLFSCDVEIFVGDMNCGPEIDNESYELLSQQGFIDCFSKLHTESKPTWDRNNMLNKKAFVYKDSISQRIDHIFLSDKTNHTEIKNIGLTFCEENIPIGNECYPISDHYGVMVELGFSK